MQFWKKLLCQHLIGLLIGILPVLFATNAYAQYSNGIPVLLYHHINDDNSDLPNLTVTPAEFERQIVMLKNAGFETISPEDFMAYMRQEPVALPDKPILITFDDGYEDNYTYAFPILKKYSFKAVIFVPGVNINKHKRLSGSQMREMSAYGIRFGGHSVNHRDLTALEGRELQHEVQDVQRDIRQVTAKTPELFAYPYGYFNLRTWEATSSAGYQAAFTVLPGLNTPERDNVYLLRRVPIYNTTDFNALFKLLDANQPKSKLLEYSPEQEE
ncbi:polysaccharide deacetylase family protein [Sporomusa acidovorans]|uniref:NodB homology domain-containing protein n=1 Tax=Sporomusa acidovorans (strain ATCC 49682 / DSM 3132 / Mol) TaxID=1123286 RepID=A0ABZ3J946_SPOA4|nr:polysaccharide deacetylase family protein [Sporomusa acidovorans]OZC17543.1 poly-beta-1,6-N-acetyl-D-glucosamine N-deacetylase precursor [Sporomusa acidovorans DSM 3132]SDF09058.1 Polysaccharide deacetylase [Sporomusa acidovorans]